MGYFKWIGWKSIAFPFVLMAFLSANGQDINLPSLDSSFLKHARSLVIEEAIEIEVKSEKEARYRHKKSFAILSSKSDERKLYNHYDSDSKIHSFKARIYNSKGELVRKLGKDDIEDISAAVGVGAYQDDRFKVLDFTYTDYPYVVEYEYEQTVKGISMAAFPDWSIQGWRESVLQSSYTLHIPDGMEFQYQSLNGRFVPKESRNTPGEVTYVWKVENLPALKQEPFGPPSSEVLPQVRISLDQFEIAGYRGGLTSWEAYGKFMHQLFQDRSEMPDELKVEVRQLVRGIEDEQKKIQILYNYMQERMRYVSIQFGIGGWQPFDPAFVHENQYGDCKALTNFMHCMLREVGIDSKPVLTYQGDRPYYALSDTFATSAFNHVILYIPSEDIWLECTSNSLPVNYLGSDNADRRGLLFGPEGGRVVQIPALGSADNHSQTHITLALKSDGSAEMSFDSKRNGASHEILRQLEDYLSHDEQREWLLSKYAIPTFKMASFNLNVSGDQPEAELRFQAQVQKYAAKMGKRIFVPLNKFTAAESVPEAIEKRQFPIVRRNGIIELDTIEIQLPEGYRVESINRKTVDLKSEFGSYHLEFLDSKSDKVRFTRKLEFFPIKKSADWYEEFRTFLLAIAKSDAQKMVLVEQKN